MVKDMRVSETDVLAPHSGALLVLMFFLFHRLPACLVGWWGVVPFALIFIFY